MNQFVKQAYVQGLAARAILRARIMQKQAGGVKDYALAGGVGAGGGALIGALINYARKKSLLQGALAGAGVGGVAGLGYQGIKDLLPGKLIDGIPIGKGKTEKWVGKNYNVAPEDQNTVAQGARDTLIPRSKGQNSDPIPVNLEDINSNPIIGDSQWQQIYGERSPEELDKIKSDWERIKVLRNTPPSEQESRESDMNTMENPSKVWPGIVS